MSTIIQNHYSKPLFKPLFKKPIENKQSLNCTFCQHFLNTFELFLNTNGTTNLEGGGYKKQKQKKRKCVNAMKLMQLLKYETYATAQIC